MPVIVCSALHRFYQLSFITTFLPSLSRYRHLRYDRNMSSNRYGLQSDASQSERRSGSFESYGSSSMGSPRRSEDLRQEDYADAPDWWRPTNVPQPRRTRVVHTPINRRPSQSQGNGVNFDPRRTYINEATPRRLPFPNASEALSQLGNTTNDLLAEDLGYDAGYVHGPRFRARPSVTPNFTGDITTFVSSIA